MLAILQRHSIFLTVLLLTLAGAFVRLYGLGTWDYYHDEIWHVYVASQPTLADVFFTNLSEDGHPILPYFLLHWLLSIWNDPWMARLPSLVAGILCIPAGYFMGRELFASKNGGIFAAFLMAFSCLMIEQSDVVRGYALMMFFAIIAMWSVYRYKANPHYSYLLLYFIAAEGAFLSEFAVAPVIAFTALYLLAGIYTHKGIKSFHMLAWVVIHLMLLAYLAWFMVALKLLGGLDFSQTHYFIKSDNQSLAHKIALTIIFFLNFINDINPFFFPAMAGGSEFAGAFFAFTFLFTVMAGCYWIIKERYWWHIACVAISVSISVAFFYLDMVPMDRSRRSIGLVIAFTILLYYGFYYVLLHGLKLKRANMPLIPVLATCTFLLVVAYANWSSGWRSLRPLEFQQTHKRTQEIFSFLDAHVEPDDILIMDWSSYFHFWNRGHCSNTVFSSKLAYSDCYKAPLFIVQSDMRVDSNMLNLAEIQTAYGELRGFPGFPKARHIWLIGIQHINVKTTLLNPQFKTHLLAALAERKQHYENEVGTLVEEHESFARWAYNSAIYKKTAYAYKCGVDDSDVPVGEDNDCLLSLALLALPKAEMDERMLKHKPYHDPAALLRKSTREALQRK